MTDYRSLARQKAKKYGLDPHIFERQINAESAFNPNARSPVGATGIAQIMPATARAWGVNPNDPNAALDAAARNMASYVKKYGGYENALRAYNAGPGAIEKSRSYGETNNYVNKILRGRDPGKLGASEPIQNLAATRKAPGASTSSTTTTTTSSNAREVDAANEANRKRAIVAGIIGKHRGPNSLLLKTGALNAITVPELKTDTQTNTSTVKTPGSPASFSTQHLPSGGGASSALAWAKSTIGAAETDGPNRGKRVDSWQQRFGMSGQPWCAMFTSLAATKGGMAKSGRTASVAAVRSQAQAGSAAYQRGFISGKQAKAGDLILFGNDHIGMVESVGPNGITMIAGNDSNKVQRRTVAFGSGDIVRPKYRSK
jgi:hypothetical protein